MFKKDIDLVKYLHSKYGLQGPLLDAGGLESPTIADYDISVAKALRLNLTLEQHRWAVVVPHPIQNDRYLAIKRPWGFVDQNYVILNPEYGDPVIEELPVLYSEQFNTVILVSVFEHVSNPYLVSDALFKLLKPGGYLINSAPFQFPYHPSPEDNFRYSPVALRRIHESSGFTWIEGDFHVNYLSSAGVGDTNPNNYGAPQSIIASYAFCRKP
jgi:SAM-dependent methyltransferase